MNTLATRLTLFAGMLAVMPGCIVLPIPNSRVEGFGVTSQVVDIETGRPVAGATVIDESNERCAVTTNADGRFKLDPRVQWHFGYLWGVISYPIWPFTGDLVNPDRSVRVLAEGYEEARFTFFPSSSGPDDVRRKTPVADVVLQVPSVPLQRRPGTRPLEGAHRPTAPSRFGQPRSPRQRRFPDQDHRRNRPA